jgi:uncharacterized protein YjbJ (UPF0337 family)
MISASLAVAYPIRQASETNMNRDRIEGHWKQFSGRLKERWSRLTHNESGIAAGKRDQRAGSMQVRQGASKEEFERQVTDFLYISRRWFRS